MMGTLVFKGLIAFWERNSLWVSYLYKHIYTNSALKSHVFLCISDQILVTYTIAIFLKSCMETLAHIWI